MSDEEFEIGDLVTTPLYGESVIYRIKCFMDRDGLKCERCRRAPYNLACPDDVHVVVAWRKHQAIAPAWPEGSEVVFAYFKLRSPKNVMLVPALQG